jgi:hypothetical protein
MLPSYALPMDPSYPDLTQLYRSPYRVTDNPNVVIEPTAYCNLRCADCYRESNDPTKPQVVMPIDEVKHTIDEALSLRSFQTLSFLGGEPLLYPQLDEAILYGVRKGLSVGVYTNGLLLHRFRARELKALGVSYIYVHVDRHQGRTATEAESIALREHFCDMFRKLDRINLGFGIVVHEEDLPGLAEVARFFQRNSDVIRFVNISTLGPGPIRGGGLAARVAQSRKVDLFQRRVCAAVLEAFGCQFTAYLGTKYRPTTPGKLLSVAGYRDGALVGSMRPEEFGGLCQDFLRAHGKYPYILSGETAKLFERCTRPGGSVRWQTVAVSMAPLLWDEGLVNICSDCTDCVLHDHHFVPMCQLGPIKNGDPYVCASVKYW